MLRIILAFVAAGALIGLLVLAIGPAALAAQLAATDPGVFSLGLLAVVLTLLCWSEALRRLLVASGASLSSWRSFLAYGTGMFGKQILPFGHAGGPALMAYAFEREVGFDYNRTLAVVTVSELVNLVSSVGLAVVGVAYVLLFVPSVPELRLVQFGVLLFATAVLVLLGVFWYRRRTIERAAVGLAGVLAGTVGRVSEGLAASLSPERIGTGVTRYYDTVDAVTADRRTVLVAYLLTQLGWLLFSLPLYFGALAVGIRLPLALVFFVVPATSLATVFPLPGGLGGFELLLGTVLVALTGIELGAAAAVVLLYRLCSYWFMVLVGGASSIYGASTTGELVTEVGGD